jgi:iron complex outermembrane receptor protein
MASATRFHSVLLTPLAAAVLALAGAARADDTPVQSVQVTARSASDSAGVTGWGQPLSRTPIQADVIDSKVLADIGATSLSDLTRIDASITDSYNAVGYWTTFTVRGFQVDNQRNFRRDGLPINAETSLPLDNKSDVEVLKGLSGMQSGTSAPGGIVNLVVKRPDADLRSATLLWSQTGTVGAAADLSQRFGERRQFGARVYLSATRLDPNFRDDKGHRSLASIATDWRIVDGSLLELEFEHSVQSQPSVPAFSTWGGVVPDPHKIDPHINLNDQPWSIPVVLQGNTMSLRFTQALATDWTLKIQALQQRLVSNDHLAFAYGLYDPVTYACDPYCNTFGPQGQYSVWDFRSDNERRQTRDLDVAVNGRFATGALRHDATAGVLETAFTGRFNDEAYNLVGVGTSDGSTVVPPDPSLTYPNTDRTERSTEFYLRDSVQVGDDWAAWGGLRHTRLHRQTAPTSTGDASTATDYRQSFTTPWLAISRQLSAHDMVYISWGEGAESSVTPNAPFFKDKGLPEPLTRSRQWEGGFKHAIGADQWGIAVYDVVQPQYADMLADPSQAASDTNEYLHVRDGNKHTRGVEGEAQTRIDRLMLRASVMAQRARNEGGSDPAIGRTPTNVPGRSVKLLADYAVAALPGLSVLANMAYEGPREVFPDDSTRIPGWTRWDLGARYVQALRGTTLTWRAGVDNLFDRRAWREAPYQYDHAYLFPLEPRTFHASLEAKF